MKFDISDALTDLCEAVHEDKFYGTATPSGKPYDPDIQISEMREKIITEWGSKEFCHNKQMDEWEDEHLPIKDRRKPRMLSCPCSRCSPVTL